MSSHPLPYHGGPVPAPGGGPIPYPGNPAPVSKLVLRPPISRNLLVNPTFVGGSLTGWNAGPWSAFFGGLPTGPGWTAMFEPPGTVDTNAIVNQTKIMVEPGGNVSAKCWGLGEYGVWGSATLCITFYDKNDVQLSKDYSTPVPNTYVWTYLTMYGQAPANASYALISFEVYLARADWPMPYPTSRWFCVNFYGTYLPGAIIGNKITYKQPLSYYLNLFTSQYKLSPNLNAWQKALLTPIDDLTNCLQFMDIAYDIDNAFGAQLDVIGEFLGASRIVPFQPSGGVSPTLDDDTYRTLLYATQARNNWDGTTASLYPIWQFIFPGAHVNIIDHQNMTADITFSGNLSSIEKDLITNGLIVPRPETVLYNPSATSSIIFGFDLNTSVISGFNIGHFA
jgi:hypothetical protein